MPYFVGVTPQSVGEPITMSWKWIDGTNKNTRFNLIDGAAPTSIQVDAYAQAKAALSNAGAPLRTMHFFIMLKTVVHLSFSLQ